MVFVTHTQFTSALVLLVRSDAALANQTAASKTLVKSLNNEGLLLWLHCYDYDAESLIMVINVIKVKKNNFEHFFCSSCGNLTAFALVDVFCLPKYFGNFDRKAVGRGESSIWQKFYSFPSQIAVNRVWNWWKLENGTHSSNYTHEFSVGMLKKCVVYYPKMAFPEFHDKWKAFPNSDQGKFSGELCSACIWKGRLFFGVTTHGLKWKENKHTS